MAPGDNPQAQLRSQPPLAPRAGAALVTPWGLPSPGFPPGAAPLHVPGLLPRRGRPCCRGGAVPRGQPLRRLLGAELWCWGAALPCAGRLRSPGPARVPLLSVSPQTRPRACSQAGKRRSRSPDPAAQAQQNHGATGEAPAAGWAPATACRVGSCHRPPCPGEERQPGPRGTDAPGLRVRPGRWHAATRGLQTGHHGFPAAPSCSLLAKGLVGNPWESTRRSCRCAAALCGRPSSHACFPRSGTAVAA